MNLKIHLVTYLHHAEGLEIKKILFINQVVCPEICGLYPLLSASWDACEDIVVRLTTGPTECTDFWKTSKMDYTVRITNLQGSWYVKARKKKPKKLGQLKTYKVRW